MRTRSPARPRRPEPSLRRSGPGLGPLGPVAPREGRRPVPSPFAPLRSGPSGLRARPLALLAVLGLSASPGLATATPDGGELEVRLGRLELAERGDRSVIAAPLSGVLSSSAVHIETLSDPPRLLIDLRGVTIEPKWQRLHVGVHGVRRARAARRPDGARVVLDLAQGADFPEVAVDAVGGRLELGIEPAPQARPVRAPEGPTGAADSTQPPATSTDPSGSATSASAPAEAEPAASRPTRPPNQEPSTRAGPDPVEPGATAPVTEVTASARLPEATGDQGPARLEQTETARREATPPARLPEATGDQGPARLEQTETARREATPPARASRPAARARSSETQVRNVRFEPRDGFYRLTVELDGDADRLDVARRGGESNPRLLVRGTTIPAELERTMDVTAIAGEALTSVSTYAEGETLIIAARIEDETEHRHWRRGNRLMWDFRSTRPRVAVYDQEGTASYGPESARMAGRVAAAKQRYTGRRISLDLKDADIQNVLRLLADVSKLNIVAADDVTGKVTIKLRNVPWDQALDIILQSKQLDKVRNGNILRVAPISVLRNEEALRLARQEAQMQLEPLTVRLIPVSYAVAAEVAPQVKALLSERGKVNIDERTNVLVVEDISDVLTKVERLVRTLDTQTPQVLIEARIVEARTNFSRELGIQWGGAANFSQSYGNQTGLNFPANIRIAGGADDQQTAREGVGIDSDFAVNLPATVGSGGGGALGFVFGSLNGGTLINLRLSAAETVGKVKIISAPKIITLDNKEAKILSGEDVPITVITANGPTTRFINAVIELKVTPHVTQDGSILMKIAAKKNELSDRIDFLGVPGILTKEAETQMIVRDGDTAVLGGLYRRNTQENENYVPFLGQIPVLGWLFKTTSRSDARDELLIFISPRIVNRSEALIAPE